MRLLVAGVLAVQVSVSADGTHLREDPSEMPDPGDLEEPEKASPILSPVTDGSVKQWVKAEMCEDSAPQECAFTCEPHCPVGVCATRIGGCCNVQAPCKDTIHLAAATVCEHSSPQATSQQCDPIQCHEGECAMRVDDYYRTGEDCHFECQVPIGMKAAAMCPTSPDQHCKMECPPKICPENQCAIRVGDCCDFNCVNEMKEQKNHAMSALKAQMGTKADELQAAEAVAEQAAEGMDCEGEDKENSECKDLAEMRSERQALVDHIDAKIALDKTTTALKSTMDEATRRNAAWQEEEDAKAAAAKAAEHVDAKAAAAAHADEAIAGVGRGLKAEAGEGDGYEATTASSTYPAELGWEIGKAERDAMGELVIGPNYLPTPTDANDPEWEAGSGPTFRRRRRQIGGADNGHDDAAGPRWDGATGVETTADRGLVAKPSTVPTKEDRDALPAGDAHREPTQTLDQTPHAEDIDPDDIGATTPEHAPEKPAGDATSGEDAPATDLPPPAADPSSQPAGQA